MVKCIFVLTEMLQSESSSECNSSVVIFCHRHGHIWIILVFQWRVRTMMLLQVAVHLFVAKRSVLRKHWN